MEKLIVHTGIVAPLDRENVDTDVILPKQFLRSIERTGFGPFLFDTWRYHDQGEPGQDCSGRPENADFVLNRPRYRAATILLARRNFGCGSSREHAAWALGQFGFRVIIAPSFGDIFFSNAFKNGLLPIRLDTLQLDRLFTRCEALDGWQLRVDLPAQQIVTQDAERFDFEIDPHQKHCLLEGLDEIGLTLQHAERIRQFEAARAIKAPWLILDEAMR
ncbi:MAG: 3-isopropylmalate dehydratase small subunit [Janthinobacterium lividum]